MQARSLLLLITFLCQPLLAQNILSAVGHTGSVTTSTQSGVVVSAGDPWTVWYRPPADADAATLGAWMHGCPQAIRELAANPHFGAATLTRTPSREFACVPAPPVARWHHVIAFPVATADEAYPQAVSFWSRWDGWEDAGTVRLAWRALDATTDEDWARAVLADQMALARAARPGTTEWPPGGGMDWADMLLSREGHGLEPVGYLPDERLFELAGYFDVDEHVPLRDVLTIRALLAAGQTSDGHALETVRVTFADLRTARAEGVPLVDAGAQVAYVDDAGQVLTLDDDAF
jgi:hypothetical protein